MTLEYLRDLGVFHSIWLVCNTLAGVAYIHLAFELWRWSKRVRRKSLTIILVLFLSFLVTCGLHHFNMLRYWHHHNDPALLVTDIPMALTSVLTSMVLVTMRDDIVELFRRGFTKTDDKSS